jgi:RimJ/RimL family protein N-acetyltransferase
MYLHLKDRVASDSGLAGLRLYVDKRNARAARVYDALGMSREHYDLFEWLNEG